MLFVIARRGTGGPPLAVQRHPVGSWPVQVRMSDADAMMPAISARRGGPVTLIARISASGQPIAASGTSSARSAMILPRPIRRTSR
jgi:cytochrome c-type biogenesis protein CcmH